MTTIYTHRRHLKLHNGRVSPDSAVTIREAALLLRRNAPHLSRDDHKRRAETYATALERADNQWTALYHEAIRATLGRAPELGDYRVSGIGRDEFSEQIKRKLRRLAKASTRCAMRARAHQWAAVHSRKEGN